MTRKNESSDTSRRSCLPDDLFVSYVHGELAASRKKTLEQHTRVCPECRLRLTAFKDAGAALDGMFSRSPRRRDLVPAAKLLSAILSQMPEHRLFYAAAEFDRFGRILAAATDRGLCFISFRATAEREYLERWAEADFEVVRSDKSLAEPFKQLGSYFKGSLKKFELPLDLRFASDFTRRVLSETRKIGYGKLLTYQDVATRIKSPTATRAVGNALGRNPIPIVIPCHRVIASGGGLGGFTGGLDLKTKLLRIEGIETTGGDLFG
jgi:methylated-DNA-[protein]-cysteine S-methyltransferase